MPEPDLERARTLVKRGHNLSRQASQAFAEAAKVTRGEPTKGDSGPTGEPANVVLQLTLENGRAPADLSAKVAAAASEHGRVDVLVITNPRAPEGAEE